MTLIKKRERDDFRSIQMQGLIHKMTAMDAGSEITPVLIQIERVNEVLCALLDQEDIEALYEFLGNYIIKEFP